MTTHLRAANEVCRRRAIRFTRSATETPPPPLALFVTVFAVIYAQTSRSSAVVARWRLDIAVGRL